MPSTGRGTSDTDIESPEFETNDLGRLTMGDGIVGQGEIEYQETVPGRWWRQYAFTLATRNEWNFGGDLQQSEFEPGVQHHLAELLDAPS